VAVAELETKVPELDLVLGGGLKPGSLVIFSGAPGTGKTILAQQISFKVATPERKAIYYTTLSESHSKLVRHLQDFSFFDSEDIEQSVDFLHLSDLAKESEDGLGSVVAEIVRRSFETHPALVVIDSAKALRDFVTQKSMRDAMYELASRVGLTDAVLLFLGEYTEEEMEATAEFSLADGIVHLSYERHEPLDRRWLRVIKMRGARHLPGAHSFSIDEHGVRVFPRLETLRPPTQKPVAGRVSTGVAEIDEMMNGGIPAGNSTAILGSSGVGKTVLALRFISEGIKLGERCLYVSFQEDPEQLLEKSEGFGWDVREAYESGRLVIHFVPEGALNLDSVAAAVRSEFSNGRIGRVAVDSLAELVVAARESERFPAYARTLVGFIRAEGASLVITSETSTLGPIAEPAGGLSYLFHNVILLRYLELQSEIRRAVNILKMRESDHEKGLAQYEINARGMTVLGKLDDVTGVLGWTALRGTESVN
jgi:circadian clock protein KaiC